VTIWSDTTDMVENNANKMFGPQYTVKNRVRSPDKKFIAPLL